jgi:hypothetical protein
MTLMVIGHHGNFTAFPFPTVKRKEKKDPSGKQWSLLNLIVGELTTSRA